ncbi:MAG: hypothetical protein ChlgKO_00400 [Chlamydiales bacterium]
MKTSDKFTGISYYSYIYYYAIERLNFMEVEKKNAIKLCSLIWFGTGVFLMWKGLHLLSSLENTKAPLLRFAAKYSSSFDQAVLLLIATALILGFLKGRVALRDVVNRTISRMQEKVALKNLFALRDLCLNAFMVVLGLLIRFLPITNDVRGFIDVVIGSGLMNGAMLFVRKLIYDKADSR